ncbi:hypothetical protein QOT17_002304 [Balamuthia mandrillaris]
MLQRLHLQLPDAQARRQRGAVRHALCRQVHQLQRAGPVHLCRTEPHAPNTVGATSGRNSREQPMNTPSITTTFFCGLGFNLNPNPEQMLHDFTTISVRLLTWLTLKGKNVKN